MKSLQILTVFVSVLFLTVAKAQESCAPGEYSFRGLCIKCHRNTFSPFGNLTRCEPCPDRMVAPRGSDSLKDCKFCGRGRFYDESLLRPKCTVCPINTFANREDSSRCIPCPGISVSGEGAIRRGNCIVCPVGQVLVRENSRPTCQQCPNGQMTFVQNSDKCGPCPIGQFRNPRSDVCLRCRPGTFNSKRGQVGCTECPVDMFQDREGYPLCKPCPEGSNTRGDTGVPFCRPECVNTPGCEVKSCPPGFEYNENTERCRRCPDGTVALTRAATPCFQCPTQGEAVPNERRTRCVCSPGMTRLQNGFCVPCPEGTTNEDGGLCI